jgi:putative DNA primase/helicase
VWQRDGLAPPEIVSDATTTYFDEQNIVGQWLEECCEIGPHKADTTENLFGSWKAWAERNGDSAGNAKVFAAKMTKLGFEAVKKTPGDSGKRGYRGLRIKPVDTTAHWQNRMDS